MTTSDDIHNVLMECKRTKTPVFISSTGIDIAFQTVLKDVDGPTIILENMVRPEYITKFSKGTKFFLQCKMLRLESTEVFPRGAFMAFSVQENSLTEETRQSERFMFMPEERVMAEILNPFDKKTILKRHVMDMSATGLSLRINVASKAFAPGLTMPQVRVNIDGKHWTSTSAEVVYNRKFLDLQGRLRIQVGLKFLKSVS